MRERLGDVRKAVVLGAAGQMGSAVQLVLASLGYVVHPYDRSACDVGSLDAVLDVADGLAEDDVLVNAAAWTDVAGAERDQVAAFEINVRGYANVSLASQSSGATCVTFGTDYVFDGTKTSPYVESDLPNPLNVYGATKLAGEALTRGIARRHYVARIATVFGVSAGRRRANFVDRIGQMRTGSTIELLAEGSISPTYAADAAELVGQLLVRRAPYGVYHLANAGACTWYELASFVRESRGADLKLVRAAPGDEGIVRRPLYSALASEKLSALGITPRPWRDAVARYLRFTHQTTATG